MERSEGNMSMKNPVTPPGIDSGIVRLVTHRLNHYATSGPLPYIYIYIYIYKAGRGGGICTVDTEQHVGIIICTVGPYINKVQRDMKDRLFRLWVFLFGVYFCSFQ
jgi:hypothetical protein